MFSYAAFLPSTFCMYSTIVAMTGWFQGRPSLAVLGIAAGAIVGWPFSALLGYVNVYCCTIINKSDETLHKCVQK